MRAGKIKQSGALLAEYMLVLALSAFMLVLAMSSWSSWQQASTARQLGVQWQLALMRLRQRALTDARAWTLCTSADGKVCQSVWNASWLAFADTNGDNQRQPNEPRMVFGPPIPPNWRIVWRGFRPSTGIVWSEWGDAALSNGTLTLCAPKAQDSSLRQWIISKSGRVRLVMPASSASTLSAARAICAAI